MKLVGICGSLRSDSYNKKILNYISSRLPSDVEFTMLDINAPLYNDDLDITSELVVKEDMIISADAVLIVTPEYNYSIPGVLKNFLDWMSIDKVPFEHKQVAIITASIGMLGGARAQYHLREVLLGLNANVIQKPEVFIANVDTKFTNGILTDEKTIKQIEKMINTLLIK